MKTIFASILLVSAVHNCSAQTVWHPVESPTDRKLHTIQFVTDYVGYIGGDSVLLKTTDGGASWAAVQIDSIPINSWQSLDIFDMHWFNEDDGMIMSGVWSGGFQTFDGGAHWEVMEFAHNGFCQTTSLFFFDENNGFAGGAGCFEGHIIDRFSNGTWNETMVPLNWNTQSWVSSIEFKDANLGLAGTFDGHLLRTTDGGFNWDTIPNSAGDSAITDFIFYPDGTIRATHANGFEWGVMISTDGGLTWGFDSETATFFYPAMNAAHLSNNGVSYIGGLAPFNNLGVIFDNAGGFWNLGTVDETVNDIASHSDSIVFLVGDSGSIYVNAVLSGVGVGNVEQVDFQLFPNPAIDQLAITGLTTEVIACAVIDLSGRVVKEFSSVNSTSVQLDVSSLTTGTYLVRLQTEDGVGTRRFVKQ